MNDHWETEQSLFDRLNEEFQFVVDLAASTNNRKVKKYLSLDKKQDALKMTWIQFDGWCFLNPPYSRGNLSKFMEACADQSCEFGIKIVVLVRFDPSTEWFQKYVDGVAAEIRMLKHRVKFQGADSAYNFPCCVAIYDGKKHRCSKYKLWSWRT